MNILFYLDPHPARESYFYNFNIIEYLLSIIESSQPDEPDQFKVLVSRPIYAKIAKQVKDCHKFFIPITDAEQAHIDKNYFTIWDNSSVAIWKDLMQGKEYISDFYCNILSRVHDDYQFDTIVYWGTNGAVKNFSSKTDIPSVAMELGNLRHPFFDSFAFDFQGVNGHSYIKDMPLEQYDAKHTLEEIQSALISCKSSNSLKSVHKQHLLKDIEYNILIPLQLADDANTILSSEFSSMLDFLKTILPELTKKGFKCFIKPHPANYNRKYNRIDHVLCKQYCNSFDNVFWLEDCDTDQKYIALYHYISKIITINSSVGFEGLLMGKDVVIMGEAAYNINKRLPDFNKFLYEPEVFGRQFKENRLKIVNLFVLKYLHTKPETLSYSNFFSAVKNQISLSQTTQNSFDSIYEVFPDLHQSKLLKQKADSIAEPINLTNPIKLNNFGNMLKKSIRYIYHLPYTHKALVLLKEKLQGL